MAITMKSEYAIRMVLMIAKENKVINCKEIVKNCTRKIPLEFAEKILADLSRNGILRTHRGRFGGYTLAKSPDEITVYDIVATVDNLDNTVRCFITPNNEENCGVSKIWLTINKKIQETLHSIKLSELLKEIE